MKKKTDSVIYSLWLNIIIQTANKQIEANKSKREHILIPVNIRLCRKYIRV